MMPELEWLEHSLLNMTENPLASQAYEFAAAAVTDYIVAGVAEVAGHKD